MKVIEKYDRSKLAEGKTSGMAFAFLKKINDKKFETTHPQSCCKDYLNDVVYCENLGESITVYGLSYSSANLFKDTNERYMAIKILGTKSGSPNKEEVKLLNNNYKNLIKVINWIEEKLNVPESKIYPADDDYYIVSFNEFWSSQPCFISLYSLLLRISDKYDGKESVEKFLDSNKLGYDQLTWNIVKFKVMLMLKGILPDQKVTKGTSSNEIHNGSGIYSYNKFTFENLSTNKA